MIVSKEISFPTANVALPSARSFVGITALFDLVMFDRILSFICMLAKKMEYSLSAFFIHMQ